jgi:hypothetical protein
VVRRRGPDDRADPAETPSALQHAGALGDELSDALVKRRSRSGLVEEVRGAGVGGANDDKDAGASVRGGVEQRLEGIGAKERIDGRGVGFEARDRAPGGGRRPEQGLGIGGGADRDVTALAVGDHQQTGLARRLGGLSERLPARRAEALEASELELDRDASRAGALDQPPAVASDGRCRGVRRRAGGRLPGIGVERGGIGVEAETDLTAPLLDELGEPIGERRLQFPGAVNP